MLSPTSSLDRLSVRCSARLLHLRELALTCPSQATFAASDRLLTYVVVQLHNEWAEFVRAFLLSCLSGAVTAAGIKVVVGEPSLQRPQAFLRKAAQLQGKKAPQKMKRRDEAGWHDPSLLIRMANLAKLSNSPTVDASLSIKSGVFAGLKAARHYYAHRNDETRLNAVNRLLQQKVAIAPHLSLMLISKPAGSANLLVVDWIEDLNVIVELMSR